MHEKSKEIGLRIKELRKLSNISAKEMSKFLGIPVELYKKYENGEEDIPVSLLFEVAQKLNVDMGLLLTGKETRMHIFTVTRKGKGVKVKRREDYEYESLAEKFIHKKAEPFIVTVKPGKGKPKMNSHPGQEFDYVLKGTLKVYIHNHEIILNEGDSIFFDSSYKHAMEAVGDKEAKFLAIIM
ncbi:transcriptional regulator [Methanothermus fervidus DSM 2088]|uniref:Transcriptional regulator n=1 Tax=Methanothermus fervidus (strain ATCC 43054 / DSM 2088 / JCM 10308 / V24 S) TaxID=523846 RepID=E3GY34_METFV|nr:transcriptional regulator [Methanothermus fervidus DSM 2088]